MNFKELTVKHEEACRRGISPREELDSALAMVESAKDKGPEIVWARRVAWRAWSRLRATGFDPGRDRTPREALSLALDLGDAKACERAWLRYWAS